MGGDGEREMMGQGGQKGGLVLHAQTWIHIRDQITPSGPSARGVSLSVSWKERLSDMSGGAPILPEATCVNFPHALVLGLMQQVTIISKNIKLTKEAGDFVPHGSYYFYDHYYDCSFYFFYLCC